MKRELGIGRCGLACCLCSENDHCDGCDNGKCPDKAWCYNLTCSKKKEIDHCFECEIDCHQGLLGKIKPYTFTEFAKRFGEEELINCLEKNEINGVIYHKNGVLGDYDDFEDVEKLILFIQTGQK